MKQLGPNWLTEPSLDFEYKKYLLLAYIQQVESELDQLRLHPASDQARIELTRMRSFLSSLAESDSMLPRELLGIDWQSCSLSYETNFDLPHELEIISSVAEFASGELTRLVKRITTLYEELAHGIHLEPVGIMPVNPVFGYLFLPEQREVMVYEYEVSPITDSSTNGTHRIKANYFTRFTTSLVNTYENIRLNLLKIGSLANPAVFLVSTDKTLPLEPTLLPLATGKLRRYLTKNPA